MAKTILKPLLDSCVQSTHRFETWLFLRFEFSVSMELLFFTMLRLIKEMDVKAYGKN
ncbi:hypothetical protein HMPREF0556_11159 [Listeria grayi DSM 20601]|uniref:Uncharacterized protein n=1 Tax=Listeria grayi DSM 20601 TaxID=525367 RepID=D7UY48_LISGR|nr:hypothetical protein HMPREF0556_11159 [Listeria grayi DSM 20601]